MTTMSPFVLSQYHYDALDRLASCSPAASDSIQRFYRMSHLATEIQGEIQRSIMQSEDQLLAQQTRRADLADCALLGTDPQRSVLNTAEHFQVAYAPYGTRHPELDLPGFNGEQPDPVTGHYLLGNGYRAFNPVLMRFNSPDSLSPFGEGGINAYAYCSGDPINRVDPTGHTPWLLKTLLRRLSFSWMKRSTPRTVNAITNPDNPLSTPTATQLGNIAGRSKSLIQPSLSSDGALSAFVNEIFFSPPTLRRELRRISNDWSRSTTSLSLRIYRVKPTPPSVRSERVFSRPPNVVDLDRAAAPRGYVGTIEVDRRTLEEKTRQWLQEHSVWRRRHSM
jgi:RHS repeat-associated protein